MGRHEPFRLRESRETFAPSANVLDVKFSEVGRERRTAWGRIKSGLQALLWAAAIGFLIPPAWVLIQTVSATIAP
jgi:hypothetical protein